MSETKETKIARRGVPVVLGIICIVLVAGLVVTNAFYSWSISSLNSQIMNLKNQNANLQDQLASLRKQVDDFQNRTDYYRYLNEFGNVSLVTPDLNFSPPVSMYRALTIALESGGWNTTWLENMTVSVLLQYFAYGHNSSMGWAGAVNSVTSPPVDWSAHQVNDTTYRYLWAIVVDYSNFRTISPRGLYYVDAATAELVDTGIII